MPRMTTDPKQKVIDALKTRPHHSFAYDGDVTLQFIPFGRDKTAANPFDARRLDTRQRFSLADAATELLNKSLALACLLNIEEGGDPGELEEKEFRSIASGGWDSLHGGYWGERIHPFLSGLSQPSERPLPATRKQKESVFTELLVQVLGDKASWDGDWDDLCQEIGLMRELSIEDVFDGGLVGEPDWSNPDPDEIAVFDEELDATLMRLRNQSLRIALRNSWAATRNRPKQADTMLIRLAEWVEGT